MTQIISQARRRIPKLKSLPARTQRQYSIPLQAEAMLRDMAFVLHVTEAVKKSILAKNERVQELAV
jgi:hypothetical protein